MINKSIKDMMRRDTHFRERMTELGYVDKPIVAVIDWDKQALYSKNNVYPFSELGDDYLALMKQTRIGFTNKRTQLTEDAVAYADELVEDGPDIPHKKVTARTSRDIFQSIFMYEMLLMNELEHHLELSDDQQIHLVGANGLTQGVDHMSKQLKGTYGVKPKVEELAL